MDEYTKTRVYDFEQLDLNDSHTKRDLFAETFIISLTDGYGTKYSGRINSRLIRYTDRSGNVYKINELYTYLGDNLDFGYYLLEGYVSIDDGYGKSFFIEIELADKNKPVITLIGDATMEVKQNDVFKDPEFKCRDASGCKTDIKYFYQNENNEVDKIDTKTPGKYIIKYYAVDGDGNETIAVRTVLVKNINSMNATSIIIILAVILVLVGSITIAIMHERKKNREEG
jgi:hypothetical protein